jgi:inositol transporter-like SP family MFS transporter
MAVFVNRAACRSLHLKRLAAWLILTFTGMNWFSLFAFVILWGSAAGFGAQAFYGLWASELFPRRYRAGAQGFIYFLVRFGIAIWSFLLPTIMDTLSFKVAGIVMIVFLVIHCIIGIVLAPSTQGKTLEEIEKERFGTVRGGEKPAVSPTTPAEQLNQQNKKGTSADHTCAFLNEKIICFLPG